MRKVLKNCLWPKFSVHRSILWILSVFFALGIMITPAQATGVYDLPTLGAGDSTWIVDSADVLSLASERKISGNLKQLAKKSGNEVRLVVIRRLDYGETIDSFADKLFAQWYPTPEEQADETLVVLDTLTNSSAIRQGETAKALLADDIAESVLTETLGIPIKEGGKYNEAIVGASDRLSAVLAGNPDPGPPEAQQLNIESTFTSAEDTDTTSATIWVVVVLVVATIIPMATYFFYVGFPGR